RSTWLAGTRLHNFHRRNSWVWPLVLVDRPLLHGPRCTIRPAASGVRRDFERVVPWRPYDPKVDCWWAARDLRRRHYTSKTDRSTNLNPEVASCRLPGLAQSGHSCLHCTCPLSGVKRTCRFALHMSAFDPKRTLVGLRGPNLRLFPNPGRVTPSCGEDNGGEP